jgi:predicted kinase
MQRKIIALWGISNAGKTTTIRRVYEQLRQEGTIIDFGRRARTEVKGAILEIDGVKIGFASQGDLGKILLKYLEPLVEAGCTVIVCATHKRGKTVEAVEKLADESGFEIVWIEKACEQTNHDDGNRKKAAEIITQVRMAIEEAQLVEA